MGDPRGSINNLPDPNVPEFRDADYENTTYVASGYDPMYDRQWEYSPAFLNGSPSGNYSPIRPWSQGWYTMPKEQRAQMLLASYMLMNIGYQEDNWALVPDDAFVIYAWGAQDDDAKAALEEQLGDRADAVFGEGSGTNRLPLKTNEFGAFQIPRDDEGAHEHLVYLSNRIEDMPGVRTPDPKVLSQDQDWWSRIKRWATEDTYNPKSSIFARAIDGGRSGPTRQAWEERGEQAGTLGAEVSMLFMAGGVFAGGRMGGLMRALVGWSKRDPTKWARTIRMGRNYLLAGALGNELYSAYLGLTETPDDYIEQIDRAVQSGAMDPNMARVAIEMMVREEQIPSSITESDWWGETDVSTDGSYAETAAAIETARSQATSDEEMAPDEPVNPFMVTDAQGNETQFVDPGASQGSWGPTSTYSGQAPEYGLDVPPDELLDKAEAHSDELARIAAQRERRAEINAQTAANLGTARAEQRGDYYGGYSSLDRVQPTRSEFDPRLSPAYADFINGDTGLAPYVGTKAPYHEGNLKDEISNWSMERTEWFQRQAVLAGLIDEEGFVAWGNRDANTRNALATVFTYANDTGDKWEDALSGMVEQYQAWKEQQPGPVGYPAFVTPAYVKPDYATLAMTTRDEMTRRLGRRPSKAELALLTSYLGEQDKLEWQSNVAEARANHAANARGYDAEAGQVTTEQSGGVVQGVDALSRFDQFFQQHFSGEIAHRERVATNEQKRQGLFSSLNRISGAI